jgi:hypothetical protein
VASWDYPVVSSPQAANYAPPVQDFSSIGNLLQDYLKGKQSGREEEKANLFRNGIPRVGGGPDGPIDVNSVTDKLARINPDYAMPLMNMQIQGQQGQTIANGIMAGQGQPSAPVAQSGAVPASVAPRAPVVQSPAGPSSATLSSTGSDNSGQDTIRSMATELAGGQDAMPAIGSAARVLRINPDAPLTPEQAAKVKQFLGNAARPVVAQDTSQAAAPAQQPQPTQPQADAPRPGWSQGDADALSLRATRLNALAAGLANVNPKSAEAAKAEAVATEARAKQIRDYISGEDSSTNEQKNANDPTVADFELKKEQQKNDVDRFGKQYDTISKVGEQADETLPQLDLAKRLVNSPDFASGTFAPASDAFKRLSVALNLNPNTATPDQVFDKIRAGSILNQIKGMAGTGPVRVAEMKFIDQMIAGRENTPATLRTLLEIESRLYQRAQAVRTMAIDYNHGHLDAGFTKKVAELKNSPQGAMFTPAEMKDPRLIAPPVFNSPRELAAAKLPHGDPFKTADGRIKYVP